MAIHQFSRATSMSEILKQIKKGGVHQEADASTFLEIFSVFRKDGSGSIFEPIHINSKLDEIERLKPFSYVKEEFEKEIDNKVEKDRYRSDKLQEIEEKYSDLEKELASDGGNVNINNWPLELAVFKTYQEDDDLYLKYFSSIIVRRHKDTLFYTKDDIEEALEIIANAIADCKMLEYLREKLKNKMDEHLVERSKEFEIFSFDKTELFLIIEQSMVDGEYISKDKKWIATKESLLCFIRVLIEFGFFKKKTKNIDKIDLRITKFFESHYEIDLKEQRKPSYFPNHTESLMPTYKILRKRIEAIKAKYGS